MSIQWRVLLLIFGVAILVILAFAKMLYFAPKALDNQEKALQKNDILAMASEIARKNSINEELFIKVMLRESNASSTIKGDYNLPRKGCVSRGLFQINSCYWPQVSDKCAFDAKCNMNWAAARFREGKIEIFNTWQR